jgi:hypothetical protein
MTRTWSGVALTHHLHAQLVLLTVLVLPRVSIGRRAFCFLTAFSTLPTPLIAAFAF